MKISQIVLSCVRPLANVNVDISTSTLYTTKAKMSSTFARYQSLLNRLYIFIL